MDRGTDGSVLLWHSRLLEAGALNVRFAVSKVPHGNMAHRNVGREQEDNAVVDGRRRGMIRQMGLVPESPYLRLCVAKPEHGDRIVRTTLTGFMDENPACDVLVSNEPGVVMAMNAADCLVAAIVDPVEKVAALAHAGYVGVGLGVLPKTVQYLAETFGSRPANLLVSLPPCWQGIEQEGSWIDYRGERLNDSAWDPYLTPVEEGHFLLRWVDRAVDQLLECGVQEGCIERSPIDTATSGEFFSRHRYAHGQQNGLDGRHACMLAIV